MNKKLLLLSTSLLLLGCSPEYGSTNSPSVSTSVSTSEPPSVVLSTSEQVSNSIEISPSISDSTSVNTEIQMSTIKQVLLKGKNLKNDEIGELVKFKATYLKAITMSRSNQDMMLFADSDSYIYLRVSYSQYQNYLAKLYKLNDYVVTANVTKNNGVVELTLNENLNDKESVVSFSETPSCDISAISETKSSISEIIEDFKLIPLNNKNYGSGKIVTFEAQLVATEYEDSNKKAVFYDGNNVITVIGEKKLVERYDIGNYYSITGVLNIEVSSPAVLALDCHLINNSYKEVTINNAQTVVPSYFKNWNLTSSKMNPPSINDYLKLYQTTGYVKYDDDRQNAYYIGVVDSVTSTLSDNGITTSIPGFYLMNHLNVDERNLSYSPFYGFIDAPEAVTFYFTLHNFDTSNHAWKVFPLIKYHTEPNPNNPNLEITIADLI